MSAPANPQRGEATLCIDGRNVALRPSFAALVAAEDELGPLFALVERASEGQLRLTEIAALFWHCCTAQAEYSRQAVGDAVLNIGLAGAAAPLRELLKQILQGRIEITPSEAR